MDQKIYYVSLVRGLQGCYVVFTATSEDIVREYCCKYMGRMWCSVYTAMQYSEITTRKTVINEDSPIELGSCSDWE